jgi:hypothetical protein
MRRLLAVALALLAAFGSLAVSASAGAISGSLSGDATLTPTGTPGIFTLNVTADGIDPTLGPFTSQSTSTANFTNPPHISITNGTFTETFAQGTFFGTSSGQGLGNGKGTATITLDLVITGGTHHFERANGELTITATIVTTGANSVSVTGTYTGNLSSVPEPSTLGLLAPVAAIGAVVTLRKRRRIADPVVA